MNVRTKKTGFTLIELLVVIAIIAILAAILFPVFAQARAKARQTSSLSNLKQLNLAFQMYAQDYDETFPYWSWWYSSDTGGCPRDDRPEACTRFESLWLNSIYPYVKNSQLYADPSDRGNLSPANSQLYWWVNTTDPAVMVNTYGINPALVNQQLSYGANEHFLGENPKMATMDKPADMMLIAESITSLICCLSQGRPDRTNPADPRHRFISRRVAYANQCDGTWWGGDQWVHLPEWEGNNCTRHNGGENIGFGDGHVKWRKAPNITDDLYFADQANN